MLRLTPTAEVLRPAPLARDERAEAVRAALRPIGVHPRRMGHAQSTGVTITYVHLSEAADAPAVVQTLAAALDWEATDVALASGAVAVTTNRG